jgi:hypothetical protein
LALLDAGNDGNDQLLRLIRMSRAVVLFSSLRVTVLERDHEQETRPLLGSEGLPIGALLSGRQRSKAIRVLCDLSEVMMQLHNLTQLSKLPLHRGNLDLCGALKQARRQLKVVWQAVGELGLPRHCGVECSTRFGQVYRLTVSAQGASLSVRVQRRWLLVGTHTLVNAAQAAR